MSTFIFIGVAANNPFAAEAAASSYSATGQPQMQQQDAGQYYGRGYSQAQSGYSSAGLGKKSYFLTKMLFIFKNSTI
jgi:hypothetical protein